MLPKNCGKLLYNAVRETLETMAFADVVPCSIKVAGEEFANDDDFTVAGPPLDNADQPIMLGPADAWGTAASVISADAGASWGDSPEPSAAPVVADDDWGIAVPSGGETGDDAAWGKSAAAANASESAADPWGEGNLVDACVSSKNKSKEADFDNMVAAQQDWCWSCMKVNSPDVHSVWFIVSQSLARSLMQNMYAGEETNLDTPVVRDLVAELTNVLGGRLMLLLENLGGKFTLTVPDIGFGMPEIPEQYALRSIVCKIVVDGEHPVKVALCFNQDGMQTAN
ncbi:MAG: hypothetical protein LBH00_09440 [Planctomycetaceae bacterium]|jgi:hypothetical protein|nr:hypothetical protein [Planctomycetaceae bacterium]